MNRYIIINLLSSHKGKKRFRFAIDAVVKFLPMDAKENDSRLLHHIARISQEGFCPDLNQAHPVWIPGARINTIQIVFKQSQQ